MAHPLGCDCELYCGEVLGKRLPADADDYHEVSLGLAKALITAVPSEIFELHRKFLCALIQERHFHADLIGKTQFERIKRRT